MYILYFIAAYFYIKLGLSLYGILEISSKPRPRYVKIVFSILYPLVISITWTIGGFISLKNYITAHT